MALIELPQGRRHPSRPNTEPSSASVELRFQFVPLGSLSGQYAINEGGPRPGDLITKTKTGSFFERLRMSLEVWRELLRGCRARAGKDVFFE